MVTLLRSRGVGILLSWCGHTAWSPPRGWLGEYKDTPQTHASAPPGSPLRRLPNSDFGQPPKPSGSFACRRMGGGKRVRAGTDSRPVHILRYIPCVAPVRSRKALECTRGWNQCTHHRTRERQAKRAPAAQDAETPPTQRSQCGETSHAHRGTSVERQATLPSCTRGIDATRTAEPAHAP